jgi:transposase
VIYVAFELSWGTWKLAFSTGPDRPTGIRTVPARCTSLVASEIMKAKARVGLPDDAQVVSCYEVGRHGFWIHRVLAHEGIHNVVVDSASFEVSRRKRRPKSDRLDAVKLVSMSSAGTTARGTSGAWSGCPRSATRIAASSIAS